MDEVERLIRRFQAAHSDVSWKLDALLDLGQSRDERVVTLLLTTMASGSEAITVRQAVVMQLRNGALTQSQRGDAARVLADIVAERPHADITLTAQAAEALGDFADVDGVVRTVGSCAMDTECHFDVRYAAFIALERVGASPETITVFNSLRPDETLGRSAQRTLLRWHVD